MAHSTRSLNGLLLKKKKYDWKISIGLDTVRDNFPRRDRDSSLEFIVVEMRIIKILFQIGISYVTIYIYIYMKMIFG